MKSFKTIKNYSILIIVTVLLVSLLTNVYMVFMNSKYKKIIGKETYNSVEEIRNRNEKTLKILDQCIKAKSVTNEELLTLYKNYNSICKEFTNLWSDYKEYGNENMISIGKKMKLTNEVPTEVYTRVESLLYEHLNYEMTTNNEKLILDGEVLDNFTVMYNMSNKINAFYNEFNESNLKDIDLDKKQITYIKKKYWINILEGINSVVESYDDYEFTFKV